MSSDATDAIAASDLAGAVDAVDDADRDLVPSLADAEADATATTPVTDQQCVPGEIPPPIPCTMTPWPDARIPYEMDGSFSAEDAAAIRAAMDEWTSRTYDQITFTPHDGETDYITIVPGSSCEAYCPYGDRGGAQVVEIASPTCASHRLGHVIGLGHQHQRFDRDRYLTVNPSAAACKTLSTWQLHTWSEDGADSVGPFDRDSVMAQASQGVDCGYGSTETTADCQFFPHWVYASRVLAPGTSPSFCDGHDALELYARRYGWHLFRSLGRDLAPDQALSNELVPGVHFDGWSDPVATWTDSQTLYLFARGTDKAIWLRQFHPSADGSGTWSDWTSLGGSILSLSVATYAGRAYACGIGDDFLLWCNWERQTGQWAGWRSFQVSPSSLALAAWGTAPMELFYYGRYDNRLWHGTLNGDSWGAWTEIDLPAAITNTHGISVISRSAGLLDVLLSADCIWHRMSPFDSTTSWDMVGCDADSTVVGTGNDYGLDIFFHAKYGVGRFDVDEMTSSGTFWLAPRPLGGTPASGPTLAPRFGTARIDMFMIGQDRTIWHRWRE